MTNIFSLRVTNLLAILLPSPADLFAFSLSSLQSQCMNLKIMPDQMENGPNCKKLCLIEVVCTVFAD